MPSSFKDDKLVGPLLEAERRSEGPSREAIDRIYGQVMVGVAVPLPPLVGDGGLTATTTASTGVQATAGTAKVTASAAGTAKATAGAATLGAKALGGGGVVAAKLKGLLLLGGLSLGGGALVVSQAPAPAPEAARAAPAVTLPEALEPSALALEPPELDERASTTPPLHEAPPLEAPEPPTRRVLKATRPTFSKRDQGLAAERALLSEAYQALGRGDSARALSALRQHRVEFAEGQLVEERAFLRIQALIVAGREVEARREARWFERRFPLSIKRRALERLLPHKKSQ